MKKKIYNFCIPFKCVGRQEPRGGLHGWYTPKRTKRYYEHVRNIFQQLYPRLNDGTHRWKLVIDVQVKGRQYADLSNCIKSIEDSLQGCIYKNDKQIWHTEAHRISVKDKKDECVYVRAEMLEEL